MTNLKEYYKILGVNRWVSDSKLRSIYHEKAKEWHPDMKMGDKTAADKFNRIRDAYEKIMAVRRKRKQKIDVILKPFEKILAKHKKPDEQPIENPPMRGKDIYADIFISFEDAVLGCSRDVMIKRLIRCNCSPDDRVSCSQCNGTGKYLKTTLLKIKIPRGVFDMQTLKIKGKGCEGEEKSENGDLLVKIHVQPSKEFERRGLDIYSRLPITYPEAVLGTEKVVSTVYGDVECKIPPGIESGAKLMLTAKGMLDETTGEVGNQYVVVHVEIPKEYNEEQELLLNQLLATMLK